MPGIVLIVLWLMGFSCANYVQRVSLVFWVAEGLYFKKIGGGHAVTVQQSCQRRVFEQF